MVQRSNILAGGTIHKHAIKNVHANHLVAQVLALCLGCLQQFAIVLQVDAVAVVDTSLRRGDTHHVQLQSVALHQRFVLIANLLNQLATHGTHTADEQVKHLVL